MAILSCHVSIKLPPKISDGQETVPICMHGYPARDLVVQSAGQSTNRALQPSS